MTAPLLAVATEPELAAEQMIIETAYNTDLGGSANQQFAQVFELHEAGSLSHLMLPLHCHPHVQVEVKIEEAPNGIPGGAALMRQIVPGYVLDGVSAHMRMIEFTRPPRVKPGKYAFTIGIRGAANASNFCILWQAPAGITTSGNAYFVATGNPPGWLPLLDSQFQPRVLAFQVYLRPN
ncbi:hypothetical protein [Solilutibacter tolerans]|nr:hypothetical protein [Lysobacter tolerans]